MTGFGTGDVTLVLTCESLTPLISDFRLYFYEILYFAIFVILLFDSRSWTWLGSAEAVDCLKKWLECKVVWDRICERCCEDMPRRNDCNMSVMSVSVS